MRRASLLALLSVVAAPWAPGPPRRDGDEEVVELRINGQEPASTLLVRRDADGTLLVRAEDLAGLAAQAAAGSDCHRRRGRLFPGRSGHGCGSALRRCDTERGNGPACASFRAYGHGPIRRFLSAGDGLAGRVPELQRVDPARRGDRRERRAARIGLFGTPGVVTNTTLVRDERQRRGAVRLDTTWTRDMPARLATLRVGDGISAPGAWGHSVRFGGVQFGTNFATQPTLVTTPLLAARGEAVVPSTVDVFINGRPVASETVPPGPFSIENLPAITGTGELQVVITDALGRQQVLTQPYYSGSILLRAGLNEYSFELGAIREDYGLESFAYGDVVAAGTFRRGITDTFTAEVHGETQVDGARALGVDTAWQVGTLGVVTATGAYGTDRNDSGWLAGLGVERSGRRIHLFPARSSLRNVSCKWVVRPSRGAKAAQLRRCRRRPRASWQPSVRLRAADLLGFARRRDRWG